MGWQGWVEGRILGMRARIEIGNVSPPTLPPPFIGISFLTGVGKGSLEKMPGPVLES